MGQLSRTTAQVENLQNRVDIISNDIIVSRNGGGDFTSIAAACASITDSSATRPYNIIVLCDLYTEDPFTIPDYTDIFLNNARLQPSNDSTNFITLGSNSAIRNGNVINAPTTGAAIYMNGGSDSTCAGLRINGGGTAYLATGGAAMTVRDSGCSGVTNGYWADAGVIIIATGSVSITTNALRVSNSGQIIGAVFGSLGGTTIDILQEDAGSVVRMTSMLIETDKVSAVDWSNLKLNVVSDKEDDEAFILTQELNIGTPELGREVCAGEGDSYTRGMLVYTYDGATYTDVSDAAASASGSTISFPNTSINTAIYIASSLFDGTDVLPHYGIKIKVSTAEVLGAGNFILEYWNGSAWTEVNHMNSYSEPPYLPTAKSFFSRIGSEHLVYNNKLAVDAWTKNDPITPSIGTDYYWMRIRIENAITTSPIIEQIKLHSNRSENDIDGWVRYFGTARPTGQLNIDFSAAGPFVGNMQSQDLFINEDVGVGYTNNRFTATTDITGVGGFLPFNLDTSTPVTLQWVGRSVSTGTTEFTIRWDWSTQGDTAYITNPTLVPGRLTTTSSKSVTAGIWEIYEAELDFSDIIARRESTPGDFIMISMQPTTLAGNFDLGPSQMIYTKWCEGGHV